MIKGFLLKLFVLWVTFGVSYEVFSRALDYTQITATISLVLSYGVVYLLEKIDS
jgi:hypothetical protein